MVPDVNARPSGRAAATGMPPPDHDSLDAYIDRSEPMSVGSSAAEPGRGYRERRSGAGLRDVGGLDVEAEHHAALMVLGDVAVRHPAAGVGDVEQDVDDLAGAHEHRVGPDEVGVLDAVAAEDEEAARAVDVEGVVHRMVG